MFFRNLSIIGLRNIETRNLSLSPGANFFYGDNGAGKSTFLEALFLLTNGKSFRGGYRQSLIKEGSTGFSLKATLGEEPGLSTDLKVIREGKERRIFLNNSAVFNRSDLVRQAPLLIFCQESLSTLVTASAGRRALLDWCLFHVEPGYHLALEQYRSVASQYNAALRNRAAAGKQWIDEYARVAEQLDSFRNNLGLLIFEQFNLSRTQLEYLPEVAVSYSRGWQPGRSLAELLEERFKDHLKQGFCSLGPHRADLRIKSNNGDVQNWASRGQVKAYFFLLFLAVIKVVTKQTGKKTIILVDDLWAEFDRSSAEKMVGLTVALNGQAFFTSTERQEKLAQQYNMALFHVKQGSIMSASARLGG